MGTVRVNEPLFSIITPSYNYSKYIRECLDSVAAQEGVSFEHIIFDAGSTDGTLDIIREYPNVDLTVEPDSGMSEAINKGFRKARGKWVMWLNTDDRLLPGALAAVAEFAQRHREADVIHGAWNFINEKGESVKRYKSAPFSLRMMVYRCCYIASTSLFLRRETTIRQGFLLNEKFKTVMDGEYYARLGMAGKKFVSFNTPLAEFRVHGEALSARRMGDKSIDACLWREKQNAECAAIRRAYGWSPFGLTSRWNFLFDMAASEYYRYKKGIRLLLTPWENKETKR